MKLKEFLPQAGIFGLKFGYNDGMEGYARLMSDMTEVCEIENNNLYQNLDEKYILVLS